MSHILQFMVFTSNWFDVNVIFHSKYNYFIQMTWQTILRWLTVGWMWHICISMNFSSQKTVNVHFLRIISFWEQRILRMVVVSMKYHRFLQGKEVLALQGCTIWIFVERKSEKEKFPFWLMCLRHTFCDLQRKQEYLTLTTETKIFHNNKRNKNISRKKNFKSLNQSKIPNLFFFLLFKYKFKRY